MTTTDAWLILLLVLALWLTLPRCARACHPAPPAARRTLAGKNKMDSLVAVCTHTAGHVIPALAQPRWV